MPHSSKSALRAHYRQKRLGLSAAGREQASAACCERILRIVKAVSGEALCVAGYSPIQNELDVMPVLAALKAEHPVALPVVMPKTRLLEFRHAFGGALKPGIYGICEPELNAPALLPDIVILPLLAFDRSGHRLGYGAGYYDHTLSVLRAQKPVIAIGAAYGMQEEPVLPAGPHDERLDMIATDAEIILL